MHLPPQVQTSSDVLPTTATTYADKGNCCGEASAEISDVHTPQALYCAEHEPEPRSYFHSFRITHDQARDDHPRARSGQPPVQGTGPIAFRAQVLSYPIGRAYGYVVAEVSFQMSRAVPQSSGDRRVHGPTKWRLSNSVEAACWCSPFPASASLEAVQFVFVQQVGTYSGKVYMYVHVCNE